ncbi:hypothetical protein HYW74_05110 [Candidatus Pacearchaeota archaeon]|nr:hypothetical protein [Candidatus Pacearchaeota archaeon]
MNEHIKSITRDQYNADYQEKLERKMKIESDCKNSLTIASGVNFVIGAGKAFYGVSNQSVELERTGFAKMGSSALIGFLYHSFQSGPDCD